MTYQVILPAAGQGKRMGAGKNKLLLELDGVPIFIYTLRVFDCDDSCSRIILAVNEDEKREIERLLAQFGIKKEVKLVSGGSERQYSVYAGVKVLENDEDIVLVHDAARPFIDSEQIQRLVEAAEQYGAAILAVPVKDTIKRAEGNKIKDTIERSSLWSVQTPQAFRTFELRKAHEQALCDQYLGTDEASLVERMGHDVIIVEGNYDNIKLTTPEDLFFAETIIAKRKSLKEKRS
ncbi:2-C-methyl-D-erythritol 4-phosphate cytidylyltransferase [Bacillus benzoevorans]|uniref:2-C-methyl-D-erythritol 4-phosphate cytidylyltransferase n=1 Tax=Bacillus benzoevorans TaxID=1456 RepID=A0A7X0LXD7_9BACI|nr:2-C-methyl-D-erythritol 4-phosphate cytidylyltransferase [Bacillus benzoevorans]MBB6447505.1 2-C-methyl-D-erythritol 4-phosphate cytidylyltransferase [Bacillus benzoevorans]